MPRIELEVIPLCTGCGRCCDSIGLPPFEVANPDLGPQPGRRTYGQEEPLADDEVKLTPRTLSGNIRVPEELLEESRFTRGLLLGTYLPFSPVRQY